MTDPNEKNDEKEDTQEEKGYPDDYPDFITEQDEADPSGWWSN